MEDKKQMKEKPLELVKPIAVNQINVGLHYEQPAEEYYKSLEAFERLYNVSLYSPNSKRGV